MWMRGVVRSVSITSIRANGQRLAFFLTVILERPTVDERRDITSDLRRFADRTELC